MGTIREVPKKGGEVTCHAEVRIKGSKPQRASFRTKTLAKKWIQDTESAIRDGRHFRTAEAKRHTVAELIDRFNAEGLARYEKYATKQKRLLMWWRGEIGHFLLADLLPAHVVAGRDKLLAGTTYRQTKRSGSTVNRYLKGDEKAKKLLEERWKDGTIDEIEKKKESIREGFGNAKLHEDWIKKAQKGYWIAMRNVRKHWDAGKYPRSESEKISIEYEFNAALLKKYQKLKERAEKGVRIAIVELEYWWAQKAVNVSTEEQTTTRDSYNSAFRGRTAIPIV